MREKKTEVQTKQLELQLDVPVVESVEENIEVKDVTEEPEVQIGEQLQLDVPEVTPVIKAKVTGCKSLNVREEGNVASNVLCTIEENSEVEINEKESTDDFYKVCLPSGVEGFCMKTYLTIE